MAKQPGPNDFNNVGGDRGVVILEQGLGADEPKEESWGEVQRQAVANKQKEEALARASREVEGKADELDKREEELNERLRLIEERERALSEPAGSDRRPVARR